MLGMVWNRALYLYDSLLDWDYGEISMWDSLDSVTPNGLEVCVTRYVNRWRCLTTDQGLVGALYLRRVTPSGL